MRFSLQVAPFLKLFTGAVTLLALIMSQLLIPSPVEAATLYYSPTSASLTVNQTWTVRVLVNTSESTAAIKYTVIFPANILTAVTANCGAQFSTTISTSIGNGTISGDCAALGQGNAYTGSAGEVAVITFKGKAAGSGNLSFGVSTIVRNGGDFGNMYTGGGSANVTVAAETTSAPPPSSGSNNSGPAPTQSPVVAQPQQTGTATPTISSSTHPDQEKWFKERNVELSWTKTANEFNFALDQTPNTQLSQQVRNGATTASETVGGDGVWYAHVRAKGEKGWSNTAHYKLQIDGSAPTSPAVSTEPASPMKVLPTITFSAEDSVSGVDYYEIKLDDGTWQRAESPYKPTQMSSGDHTVAVRAVDRAGNAAESQAKFVIVPLAAPTIDSMSQGLLMLGERFTVSGTAPSDASVEIYINGEKRETVTADKNGRFSSKESYLLFPGTYKVTAKAVNTDGITSPLSEPRSVTIDARAVSVMGLVLPGWSVFGLGSLVTVGLLLGLLWLAYRLWKQTQIWAGRLTKVEQSLDKDIAQLESELVAAVDASLANKDPQAAAAIKADIAKQIEKVEEEVEAELKQVSSMGFVVTARENQSLVAILPKRLAALPALVWSKLAPLKSLVLQMIKRKPLTASTKGDLAESKSDVSAKGNEEPVVSDEAKKALAELERKAEGKADKAAEVADSHNVIPEIGDILTPESGSEQK